VAVIAGRQVHPADLALSGAGPAMLIASLLPWYGYDATGWHPTYDGFQSGFLAFIPLLIVVLIAGASGTRAWTGAELGKVGSRGVSWDAIFLLGDAIALVLVVLFWATLPSLIGASTGAKAGTFLALFVILGQGAGALMAMASSGVQLPWRPRRAVTG
jgi:hypothetical protein